MKRIAIIGASYLQIPIVKKAKEMGVETHCFAWEDGAVCKELADYFYPVSILEKEKILEICTHIGIDGIISIASDAAVPTVCFVADALNLVSNGYSASFVSTNKYLMRKCFFENKVNSPLFILAEDISTLDNFRFPLIVKPTDRSGSRGVLKVLSESSLDEAIKRAKRESFSNQAIVEEFIFGSEVSVETISWQGRHYVLAITDKITTGEPFFVELEHHQPSQHSQEIQEKIKAETVKALTALNIKYGASHAEFKITADGIVYVIEVGARMGGDFIGSDLVKLSTGYDFVKGVIEISLGYFSEPQLSETHFSGVYFLSKETSYVANYIENAVKFNEIKIAEKTNDTIRSIQCSADRSGYFIYQANKKMNLINQ